MASTKTTLIDFSWPSDGAKSVQISGDWNQWATKEELEIKEDGGFHKMIALPENSKVLYKFIVDGNWVTKDSLPTETDSNNNVNNVVHVGPAPVTAEEKKEEPAAAVKEAADQDIRNQIPDQVSEITHSAAPAIAGIGGALGAAIASVTGVDPSLGNPREVEATGVTDAAATTRNLPSHEELSEIGLSKSPALAGATAISGAAFGTQSAVAPGVTSNEPIASKDISTTQLPSSLNPSSIEAGATLAKLGSPLANSTRTIAPPTEDEIKRAMANPAAASADVPAAGLPGKTPEAPVVAAVPPQTSSKSAAVPDNASPQTSSVPPATVDASGTSAPTEIPLASVPQAGSSTTSKVPTSISSPTEAQTSNFNTTAQPQPAVAAPTSAQPAVPAKDDVVKTKSAKKEKSNKSPPAAASTATGQPVEKKTLPTTPQTPEKPSKIKDGSQTVKEKRGSKFGTLGLSSKRKSNNDLASFAKQSAEQQNGAPQEVAPAKPLNGAAENGNGAGSETATEAPTTPNKSRDRKVSLFGKIKHALSPNSSPSK